MSATPRARGAGRAAGLTLWSAWVFLATCVACSGPAPEPGAAVDLDALLPLNVCRDVEPAGEFTCRQQATWHKCGEPWMRNACHDSCGRCYKGASSCASAPRGAAIPARLRFEGSISTFEETFELPYGNPNHPDHDAVRIGLEKGASGDAKSRYVLRADSTTTYGVDRRSLTLDLETGVLTSTTVRSGRDLGTTRVRFPADGGDLCEYANGLDALREIVARVQAGHVWRDVGFETGPRAELIGPMCYLDALSAAVGGQARSETVR